VNIKVAPVLADEVSLPLDCQPEQKLERLRMELNFAARWLLIVQDRLYRQFYRQKT
jgi:hypothetical protein